MVKSSSSKSGSSNWVRGQSVVIKVGIVIEVFLKGGDAPLQLVDFINSALQREPERVHGAFEAFEEIDLHHGDEDALAAFLGESTQNLVFVGGADCGGQIGAQKTGGMIQGESQCADLSVELLEGEEALLEVNLRVYRLGGGRSGKPPRFSISLA